MAKNCPSKYLRNGLSSGIRELNDPEKVQITYSDLSNNGTGSNKRTERKKFAKLLNIQDETNVQGR